VCCIVGYFLFGGGLCSLFFLTGSTLEDRQSETAFLLKRFPSFFRFLCFFLFGAEPVGTTTSWAGLYIKVADKDKTKYKAQKCDQQLGQDRLSGQVLYVGLLRGYVARVLEIRRLKIGLADPPSTTGCTAHFDFTMAAVVVWIRSSSVR